MVIGEGTYLVLFLFIRVENNFYNEKQLAQLGRAAPGRMSQVRVLHPLPNRGGMEGTDRGALLVSEGRSPTASTRCDTVELWFQ